MLQFPKPKNIGSLTSILLVLIKKQAQLRLRKLGPYHSDLLKILKTIRISIRSFCFIRTSKIEVRLPMILGFGNYSIFSVLKIFLKN